MGQSLERAYIDNLEGPSIQMMGLQNPKAKVDYIVLVPKALVFGYL